MSWFAEVMDHADKREFKNLRCFYCWIRENYPEAMKEWLKKEEIKRSSDIRWWI